MRHDFDFECFYPPVVNTKTINTRKENKKASFQIFLVILGSIFSIVSLLILANAMTAISPVIAFLCIAYVLISVVGSGIVFTSYRHKGGAKVWLCLMREIVTMFYLLEERGCSSVKLCLDFLKNPIQYRLS